MKRYFLGLCSHYEPMDIVRHTFTSGDEFSMSGLRAYLAAHYGATVDHVAVYNNGRTALSVALKALTKRGGKVVVTSLTCYAVVQAVKSAGMTPIFADVDKKTLHFGGKELEEAIKGEKDVQAIIVQNNLGIPADIASIEEVAKAHKLVIIEDLAHCAGIKYADGREAGTVGRAAVLSFGKGKSIDTITGGAVVFTDALDTPIEQPTELPKKADVFRARFYPLFTVIIRALYYIHPKVGKAFTAGLINMHAIKRSADGDVNTRQRMTYWQCKLALGQLQALPHQGRGPIREFYLVHDRETLLNKLEKEGYFFDDVWYTTPVAPERYFKKADFHPESCPVATELARGIINLPTWYDKSDLKPALKIIKDYALDPELAEAEFNGIMTPSEKKAKIKAEKAARKKEKKAAKKAKKAKKAGKNPKKVEKTERVERAKKEITKKEEQKKSEEPKKEQEKLDANHDSEGSSRQRERTIGSAPVTNRGSEEMQARLQSTSDEDSGAKRQTGRTTGARGSMVSSESSPESKNKAKGNAIMKQAPKKLTDREKLKLELESGKKGGPSVI